MHDISKKLTERLREGPAVLFLGQSYLGLESGVDPFVQAIQTKFASSSEATQRSPYDSLLHPSNTSNSEVILSWLDERCKRLSSPEWLRIVSQYSWNALLTSAIDSIWINAFRTPWRDVNPIFEDRFRPLNTRNTQELHSRFLFGCVNRTEAAERPPLDRFELLRKRQSATLLAARIPEITTPLGVLVIAGYDGATDWCDYDLLFPALSQLGPQQVFLFNASSAIQSHPIVQHLMQKGTLLATNTALSSTLIDAEKAGFIHFNDGSTHSPEGHSLYINGNRQVVPKQFWNAATRSAIVIEDQCIAPPKAISVDAKYQLFREFLARRDRKPDFEALRQQVAFRRDFENELRRVVDVQLHGHGISRGPILLHGATGTGKSVALGSLAFEIAKEKKFPVLFIEERVRRPAVAELDRFCMWAEDTGARVSLIIWDGMKADQEYESLISTLASRGRKVVVVGSSYKLSEQQAFNTIEAPSTISGAERGRLALFLESFHPSLRALVEQLSRHDEGSFLVALYRLLPASRSQLRSGVSREMAHAESIITRVASASPHEDRPTLLGLALAEAGISVPISSTSAELRKVDGDVLTDAEYLTGLVMVPARFGLSVPFELILRCMSFERFRAVLDAVREIDIFRWFEDEAGNIELGARTRLEAQLVIQSRFASKQSEAEIVKNLLVEIRDTELDVAHNVEISFAVDLIRAVGPQSEEPQYFFNQFKEFADILRQVREERGIIQPRLILQEANLLREWVKGLLLQGRSSSSELMRQLDEVENVLIQAIEDVQSELRGGPLRSMLLAELGATYATRAHQLVEEDETPHLVVEYFHKARRALIEAQLLDPKGFYPLDVLAWATRDALRSGKLTEDEQAEAAVDILHAFESIDPGNLDERQRTRYERRRLEIGNQLNLGAMSDDAFERLRAQGSRAGYYLRAYEYAGLPDSAKRLTSSSVSKINIGLDYLVQNYADVSTDARCMDLLLDLWWLSKTGGRLFTEERARVPLRAEQWQELLRFLDDIEKIELPVRPLRLVFLRGLCWFHLKAFSASIDVFRSLERDSDMLFGRRRVVRAYIASTAAGEPQLYHGTVAWISPDRRKGEVYVEELRQNIPFLPLEHGMDDAQVSDVVPDFHIAFNFLGPIADPVNRLSR